MEPLPHGYSHDTRSDGTIVVKRHVGPYAEIRRRTERAALTGLAGLLPVPRLLPGDDLTTGFVPGVHGQELLDAGHAAEVLRSCGVMLRRLQQVDPGTVFPGQAGAVLVHGDYGPNNMLFDPATFEVTAIVDWEWAHPGDPVDDLAWCEWIVRMHHPAEVGALGQLFAGYGSRPPWPRRQQSQLAKCRQMLELVRPGGDQAPGARHWRERLAVTASWRE